MFQRVSEGKKRKTTDKLAVERVRGAKGASWKALENDWEKSNTCEKCGDIFAKKEMEQKGSESRPKKKGKQEYGVSGSWNCQLKSTWSKLKCCALIDAQMMKQGFVAMKSGDWEENQNTFRKEVKVTEWAFDRMKEAFEQVAKDEARKLSIVQEIMIRSTDLRRIIIARESKGGVTMSYLCPHCNSFPLEDYVWWVSGG